MNCSNNYYFFNCGRGSNKALEQKKAKKSLKKSRKKYLISNYGCEYYLRDKTWERIKNQKKHETYESWKKRLSLYGFTISGYDLQRNEEHFGKPLVHEYNFEDSSKYYDFSEKGDTDTMNNLTWEEILNSYTKKPRDVITLKRGLWFYVYGDGEEVYIEAGKKHCPSSKINSTRKIDKQNFEVVYKTYLSSAPRSEIADVTYNSAYWFGIFKDMSGKN